MEFIGENTKKMSWKVKNVKKTSKPKKMILVEGLPGIGNVGKVAADFIVDTLKAEKIINFESYSLPHYVFVNEDNLVELPSINIYKKNIKRFNFIHSCGGYTTPRRKELLRFL